MAGNGTCTQLMHHACETKQHSKLQRYLNEVQPGSTRGLHQQNSYVGLWRPNAAVDHAQKDCWVAVEVHHQLLGFLHELLEHGWPYGVGVVKEKIALACQLYLQVCQGKLGCERRWQRNVNSSLQDSCTCNTGFQGCMMPPLPIALNGVSF